MRRRTMLTFRSPKRRAADPGKTLYPYSGTLFPTRMVAPMVQWNKAGVNATSVRLTLWFTRSSAATPSFTWSSIFVEPRQGRALTGIDDVELAVGDVPCSPSSSSGGSLGLRAYNFAGTNVISPKVWAALEQTARPFLQGGVRTNLGLVTDAYWGSTLSARGGVGRCERRVARR